MCLYLRLVVLEWKWGGGGRWPFSFFSSNRNKHRNLYTFCGSHSSSSALALDELVRLDAVHSYRQSISIPRTEMISDFRLIVPPLHFLFSTVILPFRFDHIFFFFVIQYFFKNGGGDKNLIKERKSIVGRKVPSLVLFVVFSCCFISVVVTKTMTRLSVTIAWLDIYTLNPKRLIFTLLVSRAAACRRKSFSTPRRKQKRIVYSSRWRASFFSFRDDNKNQSGHPSGGISCFQVDVSIATHPTQRNLYSRVTLALIP